MDKNNNNCLLSGVFGIGLLCASFFTMTIPKKEFDELTVTFSKDIALKYEAIVNERRRHYYQGLFLGFIISYFITEELKKKGMIIKNNLYHDVMVFVTIVSITSILFYLIVPKSDNIKKYITDPDQLNKWQKIHDKMRNKYIIGFIIGSLASIPISKSLCHQ